MIAVTPTRPLTHPERAERRKRIADAIASGLFVNQVAQQFGVSVETVRLAASEHWVDVKRQPCTKPRGSRVDPKLAIERYSQGVPTADIAASFGVSRQRLYQVVGNGFQGVEIAYRCQDCEAELGSSTVSRGRRNLRCKDCRKARNRTLSYGHARNRCECGGLKCKVSAKCVKCASKLDHDLVCELYRLGYGYVVQRKFFGVTGRSIQQVLVSKGIAPRTRAEGSAESRRIKPPIAQAAAEILASSFPRPSVEGGKE